MSSIKIGEHYSLWDLYLNRLDSVFKLLYYPRSYLWLVRNGDLSAYRLYTYLRVLSQLGCIKTKDKGYYQEYCPTEIKEIKLGSLNPEDFAAMWNCENYVYSIYVEDSLEWLNDY